MALPVGVPRPVVKMMTWQPAAILYPDVELMLTQRVRSALADPTVTVGRKVPDQVTRAVIVNRVGGTQSPPFDTATVMVRCYAPSDVTKLVARVVQILGGLPDGQITRVKVTGGPTDLGLEGSPMRQILADVTTRGTQ